MATLSNEFYIPLTLVIISSLILFDCQREGFTQKFPLIKRVFRTILTSERRKRSQRGLIGKQRSKPKKINFDSKNKFGKEFLIMSNNKKLVPEAKEALNRFKMEAAAEVGVNLKQGYNGNLTSKEAGSVGGQMVKKMVESYENSVKNTTNG
jgi:hypothetical protein